jgi:hypothetical protein
MMKIGEGKSCKTIILDECGKQKNVESSKVKYVTLEIGEFINHNVINVKYPATINLQAVKNSGELEVALLKDKQSANF